jgi:hypothetical protein
MIGPSSGTPVAAASSNVRVTLLREKPVPPPPASVINRTFTPVGPTSNRPMSSGKLCVSPAIWTVTLLTVPGWRETLTVEGYGDAGEASVIVIGLAFVNFTGVPHGLAIGVAVGVAVAVAVGRAVAVGEGVDVGVAEPPGVAVGVTPPVTEMTTWATLVLVLPTVSPTVNLAG